MFKKDSFDKYARGYEAIVSSSIYNKLVWSVSPQDYKNFADSSFIGSTGEILDVGCGGLILTADLYSQINNQITLFDYAPAMLEIGKNRISKRLGAVPQRMHFINGDVATKIKLIDNELKI